MKIEVGSKTKVHNSHCMPPILLLLLLLLSLPTQSSLVPTLASLSALSTFLSQGGGVLLLSPPDSITLSFHRISSRNPGLRFAISSDPSVVSAYGASARWRVVVHPFPTQFVDERRGDVRMTRYGGDKLDGKDFERFVREKYFPVVMRIVPGVEWVVVGKGKPVFVVYTKVEAELRDEGQPQLINESQAELKEGGQAERKNEGQTDLKSEVDGEPADLKNAIGRVAVQFKGKMLFGLVYEPDSRNMVDLRSDVFWAHSKDTMEAGEGLAGIKFGQRYYTMPREFSVDSATKFVQDFLDNKLKPTFVKPNHVNDVDDAISVVPDNSNEDVDIMNELHQGQMMNKEEL